MLSPTGTDPDRTVVTSAWGFPWQRDLTNPQSFHGTSMMRPATEGFKDLFSCTFLLASCTRHHLISGVIFPATCLILGGTPCHI